MADKTTSHHHNTIYNSAVTEPVAPGVVRLPIVFVNVYFVGGPRGSWFLVDTGLPGFSAYVRGMAAARYGSRPPEAILLTHGHFDHAGSALTLSKAWNAPIYAHPLELPYLTGLSDYPPQDPTVGGAIAMMSRTFPHAGYDFGHRVRALPEDGRVPGLPKWRWLHTPGHTPGHVSYYRKEDRTLLAGDAFATMNLDLWRAQVTHARKLSLPPTPFTPDWAAARESVEHLAALRPATVAAGHGRAMTGPALDAKLQRFAKTFSPPPHGRYVGHPVKAGERGVVALPPPVPDPFPRRALGAALAVAGLLALSRRRK